MSGSCSQCGGSVRYEHSYRTECPYCGTINTADLNSLGGFRIDERAVLELNCPRCQIRNWEGIAFNGSLSKQADIHRCKDCHGLFILHKQLDALLENVKNPDFSGRHFLDFLGNDPIPLETKIVYLDCPVCMNQMHRHNYHKNSGVIVDTCPAHGTWFDGGELSKLLLWKLKTPDEAQMQKLRLEQELEEAQRALRHSRTPFESSKGELSDLPMLKIIFKVLDLLF